jgi:hypothetical protein
LPRRPALIAASRASMGSRKQHLQKPLQKQWKAR